MRGRWCSVLLATAARPRALAPGRATVGRIPSPGGSGYPEVTYAVYGGAGPSVDYAAPLGATAGTSWDLGPLGPGVWSFAVRASSGGLEEENLDCRVTIQLDGSGRDLSGRPSAPSGVRAVPLAGAGVRVEWRPPSAGPVPGEYRVYLTAGGPPGVAGSPAAIVAATGGFLGHYRCELSGLVDGLSYGVAVTAASGAAESSGWSGASFVARSSGPGAVDGLAAAVIV